MSHLSDLGGYEPWVPVSADLVHIDRYVRFLIYAVNVRFITDEVYARLFHHAQFARNAMPCGKCGDLARNVHFCPSCPI